MTEMTVTIFILIPVQVLMASIVIRTKTIIFPDFTYWRIELPHCIRHVSQ